MGGRNNWGSCALLSPCAGFSSLQRGLPSARNYTGLGERVVPRLRESPEISRSGFFPILQVQKHLQDQEQGLLPDSGASVKAGPPVQAEPPV